MSDGFTCCAVVVYWLQMTMSVKNTLIVTVQTRHVRTQRVLMCVVVMSAMNTMLLILMEASTAAVRYSVYQLLTDIIKSRESCCVLRQSLYGLPCQIIGAILGFSVRLAYIQCIVVVARVAIFFVKAIHTLLVLCSARYEIKNIVLQSMSQKL